MIVEHPVKHKQGGKRPGAGAPVGNLNAIGGRPVDRAIRAAKAKKESYLAHLAELEYQQKRAGLISQTSITTVLDGAVAAIHHHFDSLPTDLSQRIAASSDACEIDLLLAGEIRARLEAVADTPPPMVTP